MADNDVFCKIVDREIPTNFIYEDAEVVAFNDINPKCDVHILVVPKKHFDSVADLAGEEMLIIAKMVSVAKKLAEDLGFAEKGYKLHFNVRHGGGQLVEHLHLHLLSGKCREGMV